MTKNKQPKIKADDFVEYEGSDSGAENFTNFEELLKKVELLKENLDEIVGILRDNNLVMKKEIEAPYFDDDEIYKRLEADEE